MPISDKQYMGMSQAYLSASNKLLRLQVEHERLQVKNKFLNEACQDLIKKATKVLVLAPASIGETAQALHALSQTINQVLDPKCPLAEKMV